MQNCKHIVKYQLLNKNRLDDSAILLSQSFFLHQTERHITSSKIFFRLCLESIPTLGITFQSGIPAILGTTWPAKEPRPWKPLTVNTENSVGRGSFALPNILLEHPRLAQNAFYYEQLGPEGLRRNYTRVFPGLTTSTRPPRRSRESRDAGSASLRSQRLQQGRQTPGLS